MMFRAFTSLVAVSLLAAGLVVTGSSSPAWAESPKVLRVLLVGDSYMAGNGARQVTGDGDEVMDFYGSDTCFRSRANWAEQWAKAFTASTGTSVYLENHACSGGLARDYFSSRNDRPGDPVGITGTISPWELSDRTESGVRAWIEQRYACATDQSDDTDRPVAGDVRTLMIDQLSLPVAGDPNQTVTFAANCRSYLAPQQRFVDASWDLVLVSLGGNDVGFGSTVASCFVLPIPMVQSYNKDACVGSVMTPAPADGLERSIVDAFSSSATENVRAALTDVMGRIGSSTRVAYLGYPGMEYDRNYSIGESTSPAGTCCGVVIGPRIQALQLLLEDKQRSLVNDLNTQFGNRVTFVPMLNPSIGHENHGLGGARSALPAPAGATSGTDRWQWDVPEDFPTEISWVGPGGQDFHYSGESTRWNPLDNWSHHSQEYYHYNPLGHANVAEQLWLQGVGQGVTPTGSDPGSVGRGLSVPRYLKAGNCSLNTRWGGFYSTGMQVTVTGPGGSVYDALDGTGCLDLPQVGTASLDVHVVIPQWGIDSHVWYAVDVTDDGDPVPAASDNCPSVANAFQADVDADGQGDRCDAETTGSEWWFGDPLTWQVPPLARSFGDPHLVTLDGLAYSFQAAGEFMLMSVPSRGVEAQVRYEPTAPGLSVSWTSATVIGVGSDRVEVRDAWAGTQQVLVNGVEAAVDAPIGLSLGGAVYRVGRYVVVQTYRGVVFVFGTGSVRVKVAPGVSTGGLLGDHDGSRTGDLKRADGVVVDPSDRVALYSGFADSWRVTQESSLFTYVSGASTASYTDRAFPPNVTTLADFMPAELDAANATCIAAGVKAGSAMEACALDVLVTASETFVSAAAAAAPGVDPAAVSFNGGVLRQSFDSSVSTSFSAKQYVRVDASSIAAGPFFDDSSYKFAMVSVPRHSQATVSARLLVIGATESDTETQQVSVDVDGVATAVLRLEGGGEVISGPSGSTVVFTGTGTLVDGTPYRAYDVSVPVAHATEAMKVTMSPSGFHAVLGTGVAMDSVQVQLVTLPADVKSSLTLPFTAGGVQGSAFGAIEAAGGADEYRFTVATATDVLLETAQASSAARIDLVNTVTGEWIAPSDRNYHQLYRGLPAGTFSVVVTAAGQTVSSYAFQAMVAPPAQQFTMNAGDAISDGLIGGVAVAGAGNLETSASRDVYRFSVAAAQAGPWVFESGGIMPTCREAVLVSEADEAVLGSPCTTTGFRLERSLAEGSYRIEVPVWLGGTGGYRISSYAKPAPQVFAYSMGQSITGGFIGGAAVAGAGMLETPASVDVYAFTIGAADAGKTWVFPGQPIMTECRDAQLYPGVSGGVSLGPVCVATTREYTLAAGDYRIEVPSYNSGTGTYSLYPYVKSPAEVFDYQLGQTVADQLIGGVSVAGAGRLETGTSMDVYRFTVTADQAGKTWVFDANGNGIWPRCNASRLMPGVSGGSSLGSVCRHFEVTLAAGDYRIEVPAGSNGAGAYSFTSYLKPAPQVFAYSIGQAVSNGLVGGVAAPGAGNLETTSSLDVYLFTVTPAQAASLVVFDGAAGGLYPRCNASRILPVGGTTSLGGICGHAELSLAAGDYRIEVPIGGNGAGAYGFTSYLKPAPQVFAYSIGQAVSNGLVGGVAAPGAGNLETTSSLDVYMFTVTPAQAASLVVFDGGGGLYPRCNASRILPVGGTTSLGGICGHAELRLSAGDYRIEVPVGSNGSGTYPFTSSLKALPQEFVYSLGQTVADGTVGGAATVGAGNVEVGSSGDIYRFTVSAAQATRTWVFDGSGAGCSTSARLYPGATGGTSVGTVCGHLEKVLAAGNYRIEFPASPTGTYSFTSAEKPQSFTYSLGQVIANGTINGTATTGAGNLETALSKDVYTFTVSAGQASNTWVFDGSGVGCSTAALLYPGTSGGTAVGSVCGHLETTLVAGTWRLEVPASSSVTGAYTIASFVKPLPQEFTYSLGQSVADGTIGGVATTGAGNIETGSAGDIYRFTVSAAQASQTWAFDASGTACSTAAQLYPGTAGSTAIGSVCGHLETTLAAGDYRIEMPATPTGTYTLTSGEK